MRLLLWAYVLIIVVGAVNSRIVPDLIATVVRVVRMPVNVAVRYSSHKYPATRKVFHCFPLRVGCPTWRCPKRHTMSGENVSNTLSHGFERVQCIVKREVLPLRDRVLRSAREISAEGVGDPDLSRGRLTAVRSDYDYLDGSRTVGDRSIERDIRSEFGFMVCECPGSRAGRRFCCGSKTILGPYALIEPLQLMSEVGLVRGRFASLLLQCCLGGIRGGSGSISGLLRGFCGLDSGRRLVMNVGGLFAQRGQLRLHYAKLTACGSPGGIREQAEASREDRHQPLRDGSQEMPLGWFLMSCAYLCSLGGVLFGGAIGTARDWRGALSRMASCLWFFFLMGVFVHFGLPMVDPNIAALSNTLQK